MSVGNWIKKGIVTFSLATANVEKEMLQQSNEGVDTGNAVINPYYRNQLMADLKEGRVTQQVKEFRKHHYQVLQASEKYKAKWGKDGDFEMLTEEDINKRRTAQGDPYDNYPVEVVVDNQPQTKSLFEYDEKVFPIKVRRGVFPKCKIEEHTKMVHIRDIDGHRKLIDFYIEDIPDNRIAVLESRNLIANPGIIDFNNITNLSFTTPGGNMLQFEYKMLAFDKVVRHNGNYIVKMFAESIKHGEWAAEKYMIID
jgi:hypothetical protein